MTLAEKLLQGFQELPEDKKQHAIDFVEFLKSKQQQREREVKKSSTKQVEVAGYGISV